MFENLFAGTGLKHRYLSDLGFSIPDPIEDGHTVEENATLLIHEVGHLVRDHEARKKAAGITDHRRWNTAGDCEINDDLHAEGLPLPGDPPLPAKYGLESGDTAEVYYKQLSGARASTASDPRERSGPAKRPATERVGESERRSPSDEIGAPCTTRTCDLLVRSQTLYPAELRARGPIRDLLQGPEPVA